MHGQILDEFGGGRIGIGRFVDTWAASFGRLGEAGLAAMALAALAGLLGSRLVGGGADGGCSFNVGDLRGGLAEWRWGLGRFDGLFKFALLFSTAGAGDLRGRLAEWRWGLGRWDGFLEVALLFATAGAGESSDFGIG